MDSTPEDKDSLISNFCNITGVEPSRGQLYLESSQWNLELAVRSFFEDMPGDGQHDTHTAEEQQRAQQLQQMLGNRPIVDTNSNSSDEMVALPDPPLPTSAPKAAKSESRPKPTSNFATLDSLRGEEDSGESSGEEGQTFFAGGSEQSGQNILGPKRHKNAGELVKNLFSSAREHGAEVVDPSEEAAKPKSRVHAFGGTGFKLGSTSQESTSIAGPPLPHRQPNPDRVLKLWSNGFSVDDGPLRDYKDPQNEEFLKSVGRGEIPRELTRESGGNEVHLNLEDHKTEPYVAPKRRVQAFAGEGFRLGNPTAEVVTTNTQSNATTDPKVSEAEALNNLNVNPSLPTTSIQIRLSDGSRLVVKLNLVHTIAHIRQYICSSRPAYSAQNFVLMTTFPNKELADESLTIEAANLANASIVQRLK